MRFLASLPDGSAAQVFVNYLLTRGIDATVEQGSNGFAVWVHDDDKVAEATTELEQFNRNPADPRFAAAAEEAREIREFAERHAERRRKQHIDVRTGWSKAASAQIPLTILLIVISGIVTAMTNFGHKEEVVNRLRYESLHYADDQHLFVEAPAADIRGGQVWRLVTPIFVHMDFLHILFNMMWLYQLGGMIERRKGAALFGMLVLASAVVSNTGEYTYEYAALHASAYSGLFGGMSGVVYALLGYVWMKQRYQPYEQMGVSGQTVIFMLVWMVLGMLHVIRDVANAAHFSGLLIGIIMGAAPTIWKRVMK